MSVTDPNFNPSGDALIAEIKEAANALAAVIGKVEPGRRRTLALHRLEEASMWAVKAQAVGDD